MTITRAARQVGSTLAVLVALGAACALAPACGSSDDTGDPGEGGDADAGDTRPPTPPEYDRPVTRPDDATAVAERAACKFARGALPDETLGASVPVGKDLPIETILVLMQENRSFDQYFGHYPAYAQRSDVEVPPETASNPRKTGADPGGAPVPWHRAEHLCIKDTSHSWEGSHEEYDDGKNDGFVEANEEGPAGSLGDGARAMGWHDERELPFYYALAKSFGLGDHYFSSLLGPTWPNRMYLFAATSFGRTTNIFPFIDDHPFPASDAVVLDELDKRHVDWKLYTGGGPPGVTTIVGVTLSQRWGRNVVFSMDDFYADAAAGKLPPVAFLDANFIDTANPEGQTEHPPSDPQAGQKFTSDIVRALFASPQWPKLAFFVTYDEHGGLYDHVPPPPACVPDDKPPVDDEDAPIPGAAFDRYGFRVPFLVVSPFAKKGYVGHGTYDHTSVLRLIQAKHRLPALTARDANADVPLEFFDWSAPNLVPPSLPDPPIDPGELDYCNANFAR
jgi:phospholipase C